MLEGPWATVGFCGRVGTLGEPDWKTEGWEAKAGTCENVIFSLVLLKK